MGDGVGDREPTALSDHFAQRRPARELERDPDRAAALEHSAAANLGEVRVPNGGAAPDRLANLVAQVRDGDCDARGGELDDGAGQDVPGLVSVTIDVGGDQALDLVRAAAVGEREQREHKVILRRTPKSHLTS